MHFDEKWYSTGKQSGFLLGLLPLPKKLAGRALALWLPFAVSISGICTAAFPPAGIRTPAGRNYQRKIQDLLEQSHAFSGQGQFEEACQAAAQANELAQRFRDKRWRAKALLVASACRIRLFDYRQAQQAAETSRQLALEVHEQGDAGAATVNLATIYLQLGDYRLAGKEAGYAADLLAGQPNKQRLVKALLIYADTEAERARNQMGAQRRSGNGPSAQSELAQLERNYRRGIDVAHAAGLSHLEANLWEELGYSLLLAHHPEKAEHPLAKAWSLEAANHDEDGLANNEAHQAELQLQKGNYEHALKLINRAFASRSVSFRTTPQFYPLHIRGVLLEKLNRENEALAQLRQAVNAANEWRQGALPGDATSTRTVVVLHDVYHDYAQLAADLSLRNHDNELARDGLKVLAENRAANLREEITLTLSRKQQLPPHYFDLLRELQRAQARVSLGENHPEDKVRLQQVRLEIGSIENKFGVRLQNSLQNVERNSPQNSLRGIQRRLSAEQALLSFCLGPDQSFLWTVTADRVSVYKLPPEKEIADIARQFSRDVALGRDPKTAGLKLSRQLFGKLPRDVWNKCQWLLAGEGPLLEGIPFSSLVDLSSGYRVTFLTETHTIRLIPSELFLLSADKIRAEPLFVGIGDPIYNAADSRRSQHEGTDQAPNRASLALARLAGSAREVRSAARESRLPQTRVLTGPAATIAGVRSAIAENPEILHFAVHVVAPEGETSQAALALSLTKDNMPELLTPEAIAVMRVPGSLVILSGCSSETGEVLPGAGLMGLSRAWLLAGASAVVVSAWPTPDDSGRFFSSFYSHFSATSGVSLGQRAARALEQAQLDMQQGTDYRRCPKFWAAYSIISKE